MSALGRCFRLSAALCVPARYSAESVAYIRRRPIVEKRRRNNGKLGLYSLVNRHSMAGSKVDLTVPLRSREIFKLQSFPDVTITQMCGSTISYRDFYICSEFSVYFIKTKAHICINELACHRGYFVGLLFREISLKREEQK